VQALKDKQTQHVKQLLNEELRAQNQIHFRSQQLQHKFDHQQSLSLDEIIEESKKKGVEFAMRQKFPIEHIDAQKRKQDLEAKLRQQKDEHVRSRSVELSQLQEV